MAAEAPKKKGKERKPVTVAKSLMDLQRMKLEKLMENPDKVAPIPEPPKERVLPPPPEFNRNVMGSSAGAGSGEFHVYRHIRRREYARQKYIGERAEKEIKDEEFHHKIEENKRQAEERTAKKRAKRLKKKLNAKLRKTEKSESDPKPEDDESKKTDSDED